MLLCSLPAPMVAAFAIAGGALVAMVFLFVGMELAVRSAGKQPRVIVR